MGTVEGTLAMPRKSLNNNFYWASELMKGHDRTVRLRLNHNKSEAGIIGSAHLLWNPETEHLDYMATITDEKIDAEVARMIEQGDAVKVSLGLNATKTQEICKEGSNECMDAPIDVEFDEMSILIGEDPGIPESTLQLTEMKCGKQCMELFSESLKYSGKTNTSVEEETNDNRVMTNNDNVKSDEELAAEFDAKVAAAVDARVDAITREKAEADLKEKAEADAKAKADADAKTKADELAKKEADAKLEADEQDKAKIEAIVEERVKAALEESKKDIEEAQRKSEVSESRNSNDFTEANVEEHLKLMERVLLGESVTIKLDKEEIVEKFTVPTKSVFDEAVSTSGTIPGISTGHAIVIIPGGIKVKSIRPWVEVRTIKQGEDKTRFYTLTIPAFGAITEHVSTEITPATHTLTGTDLAADTPRGFRQNVLKTELEKYPSELLEKIRETARRRALEDEVTNVLSTTAAATTVDFGANHFDDVGALVTDETAEDATTALTAAALEACKQRLDEQGHDPEGGGAVAAISPRQQKELIQDTTVVRFIQQVADGTISRSGKIAMYFGLEIFVTNSLAEENNSTRAIVFMKQQAFGFATARDLELEFDKNINRQSVDIVATHRINSVIKDATAYCIVSSKAD